LKVNNLAFATSPPGKGSKISDIIDAGKAEKAATRTSHSLEPVIGPEANFYGAIS